MPRLLFNIHLWLVPVPVCLPCTVLWSVFLRVFCCCFGLGTKEVLSDGGQNVMYTLLAMVLLFTVVAVFFSTFMPYDAHKYPLNTMVTVKQHSCGFIFVSVDELKS